MTMIVDRPAGAWRSFILKKFLVGATGAFLCFFLLIHVIGSSLILVGPEAFNHYSHALAQAKLTILIELALLVSFLLHAGLAGYLAGTNRRRRERGYAVQADGAKQAGVASRTMIWHGSLLFAFVVFHLVTLKWGPHYTVTYGGEVMRDLYRLAVESFSRLWVVVFYCASVAALGVHLSHGVPSFFQSLGLASASHPLLRRLGLAYAVFISGGFMLLPVYAYLFLRG
ncbi:MAG: cytochrome B subunit [Azospirillum sp.]|nr:cytochrome B subunit [Azospirillum sp.]